MFSALKGRLQKKEITSVTHLKEKSSFLSVTHTEESLLPLKRANNEDNSKSEDPYTLSVHSVLSNRKRERENSIAYDLSSDVPLNTLASSPPNNTEDADRVLEPAHVQESAQADDSNPLQKLLRSSISEKVSANCRAIPLPTPCLLSEEKIVGQRNLALSALTMCMRTTSYFWSPSDSSDRYGTVLTLPNSWGLPKCVESYLHRVFLAEDVSTNSKGKDDAFPEAEEFQLLENVYNELGAKQKSVSSASNSSISSINKAKTDINIGENQKGEDALGHPQLAHLIHAIWYLITAQWRHAVLGGSSSNTEISSESSSNTGWCYLVYLHEHRMLPESIKFAKGHKVALQLEAWRGAQRVRRNALELLAHLLRDYRSIFPGSKASCNHNAASQIAQSEMEGCSQIDASIAPSFSYDSSRDWFLVPAEVQQSLEEMIVKSIQKEKNFTAARQVYTDMTLGTANWKVGLFSAGEVHMRRSIERIERNRIVHLLNNEHAMRMLHSMRELMNVAEKTLTPRERAEFFIQSANSDH